MKGYVLTAMILLDESPAPTWCIGADRNYFYFNKSWLAFTGKSLEQQTNYGWVEEIHPDDRKKHEEIFWDSFDLRQSFEITYRLRNYNREYRWIVDKGNPVYDKDQNFIGYIGTFYDITDLKKTEEKLVESVERYKSLYDNAQVGLYRTRISDGKVLEANERMAQIFGYSNVDMFINEYTTSEHYIDPGTREHLLQELNKNSEVKAYDARFSKKDGSICWARYTARIYPEKGYIEGVMLDVTEEKRAEEQLHFQAFHDTLTGLPNRRMFTDILSISLENAKRDGRKLAVMFLDLDKFKVVNDTLGHAAGDELLKEVARRLKKTLRKGDTVARLAGDEFTIILDSFKDSQQTAKVAGKILEAFKEPCNIGGHELRITSSIGISIFPNDGEDVHTLMTNADAAMYRAKEQGRNNYSFYISSMNFHMQERLEMEKGLKRALKNNEFVLYYQPQQDLCTGKISGLEALLHWKHPEKGLLLPSDFIPIAEDTGLMAPILEWMLLNACKHNIEWEKSGYPKIRTKVKVYSLQYENKNFVEIIEKILEKTGLPPERLGLEVKENIIFKSSSVSSVTLGRLKEMGIQSAIDDFGLGPSSIIELSRLPIDIIKIDKSFIGGLSEDKRKSALVKSIIMLAHSLDIKTIAEGVEEKSTAEFLKGLDCDYVQGYYLSHPLTLVDIRSMFNPEDFKY